MDSETLLREISEFCRSAGMAESTFGRLAVNDGKLVSRLRFGGKVMDETTERVRSFISQNKTENTVSAKVPAETASPSTSGSGSAGGTGKGEKVEFRFYDNRQKYLMFVTTCSEKQVVAQRVTMELGNLHPRPPAV